MAFTIEWDSERSGVNQKERTITIFLSFPPGFTGSLTKDDFIFQRRTGEDPNFTWHTVYTPPGANSDWKFMVQGSETEWYIVGKPKDEDDDFEGFYRFSFPEDTFPDQEDIIDLPSQDEELFELVARNKIEDESLYMTGLSNNTIYSLNPYTGKATRISDRTNFSRESQEEDERVNQIFPQDLQLIEAADGSEPAVHMLGAAPPGLFLVNFLKNSNTRGEARRLNDSPNNFNLEESISVEDFATSDTKIWLSATEKLYSINPEAFIATEINNLFSVTDGLAYGSFNPLEDEKLYRISSDGILSNIDSETGVLGIDGVGTISDIRSMTFVKNRLYALKQDGVYRIGADGSDEKLNAKPNITIEISDEETEEEIDPKGIASDGTILYMIGQSTKALYSIDIEDNLAPKENPEEANVYPTRGLATKIVDLDLEEIQENEIDSLFYFTGNLYTYGETSKRLFRIDLSDGSLTQPNTYGFGISHLVLTGLTERNARFYAVGILGETGRLFQIDRNTGIAKISDDNGKLSKKNFGTVNQRLPTAIEYVSGSPSICYMVGAQHNNQFEQAALYSLDLDDGTATRMGSDDIVNFGVGESSPTGLAYIPGSDNNEEDTGTLYMVGGATARLYTLDIDETSDNYGKATVVNPAMIGFGVNEFAPQGLTYIESRTRAFISEPEEFVGVPAPKRVFGNKIPVVRRNKFYLDVTWNKNINENDFQDQDITPQDGIGGSEEKITNIGTAGTSYQFRIEVTIGSSDGDGSILIMIPSIEESPQITKRIAFDLDIPTYDGNTWEVYDNETKTWKPIEDQTRTVSPAEVRVNLKYSTTIPKPEDFYAEILVGEIRYKSTDNILSVTGSKTRPKIRVQLPPDFEGFLRVGVKEDTLLNENGVLGPLSSTASPYFHFDTITG